MAIRTRYSASDEIGVFSCLTNSYYELDEHIPVFQTTIGGGATIGCMSIGNAKGLVLPSTTTDKELKHIRNSLPDDVVVRRLEDSPTALGNCCSTNDYVCLIHPELDREIEEMLADTLDVEVFRETIGEQNLVGTYSVFTNAGGIVSHSLFHYSGTLGHWNPYIYRNNI